MTAADAIAALDLPENAQVKRRVPKTLLLENGTPTGADKRHITKGVEELLWVAALKPTTVGVPEYRDEDREYLEIAVLHLTLRAGAKASRLMELVHRAVPYPVLLITEQAGHAGISAAHKRWAQNEAGKTVLDGDVVAAIWGRESEPQLLTGFREALALARQPHATMRALYQGWMDTLIAFKAALLSGNFQPPTDPAKAMERRQALQECARLDAEIARLRAAARQEKQMARKVDINLELKRIEAAHAEARAKL